MMRSRASLAMAVGFLGILQTKIPGSFKSNISMLFLFAPKIKDPCGKTSAKISWGSSLKLSNKAISGHVLSG